MKTVLDEAVLSLKMDLRILSQWMNSGITVDDLNSSQTLKVETIREQIDAIENYSSASLVWSYGKLLLGVFENENISETILQKISTLFAQEWGSLEPEIRKYSIYLWSLLIESENYQQFLKLENQGCLYLTFLKKCFYAMKNEEVCSDYSVMVLDSCVPCMLYLVHDFQHHNRVILYKIFDLLFMQLLEPSCLESQVVVKSVLKSCDWKIADSIKEMFNDVLISGDMDGPYSSYSYVYEIILELIKTSKNLVVGLTNNIELCLRPGREDRLKGLHFFCSLFTSNSIPNLSHPSEFYSHLWEVFLKHCRNTSLGEPKELVLLAKHSHLFLSHTGTQKDWCSVLFFFLKHIIPHECEMRFIAGLTKGLQRHFKLGYAENAESLKSLIKELLTPGHKIERVGDSRDLLLNNLSDFYLKCAVAGKADPSLQEKHKMSSYLLSCLFGTCEPTVPILRRWTKLRELFVMKLVPFNYHNGDRMKLFHYLWIHSDQDIWTKLHELFARTKEIRKWFAVLVQTIVKQNALTPEQCSSHHYDACVKLHLLFIKKNFNNFISNFTKVLMSSPGMVHSLVKILNQVSSCEENDILCKEIKSQCQSSLGKEEMDYLDELLYYVAEITFDRESMKHLVDIVNSCVVGNEIASSFGMNRLHVARMSLSLLKEVLFMIPSLGFDVVVIKFILDWCKPSNGSLSMLALRCLTIISYYCKLGTMMPALRNEILPLCLQIVECESRGQIKMAIKCIAAYTSKQEQTLRNVLNIITSDLSNVSDLEPFERAVSALGHFASVCPASMKKEVEALCTSALLQNVVGRFLEQELSKTMTSDSDSPSTFVDWEELPQHVAIKVQALRSIGRCLYYCGSTTSVSKALASLQKAMTLTKNDVSQDFREVDVDQIRLAAALAVLFILEEAEFQPLISKQLLSSLAQMILDPRIEVRSSFARKLCQGLSPHKTKSSAGGTRGNLPPCMLGLLALLGSDLWMKQQRSKMEAEDLVRLVLNSRSCFIREKSVNNGTVAFQRLFESEPLLVLENILVIAVPFLAERVGGEMENTEVPTEDFESLVEVAQCFRFISEMINDGYTLSGQVSKQYMTSLVETAKQSILTSGPAEERKYVVALQAVELAVKHYRPNRRCKEPLCPPGHLPPPFFSVQGSTTPLRDTNIISVPDLRKIEALVYQSRERKLDHRFSYRYESRDSSDKEDEFNVSENSLHDFSYSTEETTEIEESKILEEASPRFVSPSSTINSFTSSEFTQASVRPSIWQSTPVGADTMSHRRMSTQNIDTTNYF